MSVRLFLRFICVAGLAAFVSACGPSGMGGRAPEPNLAAPTTPVQSHPLGANAAAQPNAIGSGPTKVGLILPLTQNGSPSSVGQSLRNAAELAYDEASSNDLTLLVKDDRSSPDGARDATQAALNEGSRADPRPAVRR